MLEGVPERLFTNTGYDNPSKTQHLLIQEHT